MRQAKLVYLYAKKQEVKNYIYIMVTVNIL